MQLKKNKYHTKLYVHVNNLHTLLIVLAVHIYIADKTSQPLKYFITIVSDGRVELDEHFMFVSFIVYLGKFKTRTL